MKTPTRICPGCGSDQVVRDGRSPNGKQRYWCKACNLSHRDNLAKRQKRAQRMPRCKACNLSHRDNPEPRGYTEAEKEVILKAYQERASLLGLERVFGVSRKTISAWLKKKPLRSHR